MSKLNFQYAKGRFLNPAKIVDASIYEKQAKEVNDKGEYPVVVRVAFAMDTENKDKATLYSDVLQSWSAAEQFIASVPSEK